MIGLFTDPSKRSIVDLVRRSAQIAAPKTEFRVLELEKRPDSRAIEAREFAREIIDMEACIIDMDRQSMVHYAVEVGSLAVGINYWAVYGHADHESMSYLDRRILLLTCKPLANSEGFRYFGEYYTMMSLAEGSPAEQIQTLAQWISDTVASAQARVFVSYRSTQQAFARKVANSLRRRGAAIWFDEMKIRPGQSIPGAISHGLGWCTHMVMCVDETFFDSEWTKAEYESVLHRYMT